MSGSPWDGGVGRDAGAAVEVDVLVAGGGPVGLATALHARAAGLSVLVVEPREMPVDKACGEGLMPAAVAELAALGVHPVGRPFVGIRYLGRGRSVDSRFAAGPGLGVRRTALHEALTEACSRAGVQTMRGSVHQVAQDAASVSAVVETRAARVSADADPHRADPLHTALHRDLAPDARAVRGGWLVAADGLHSPLRRELGLGVGGARRPRYGLRRHFAATPWSDHVEVHWAAQAEAYVTPVSDDLVGVAFLGRRTGSSYEETLGAFPELAARLTGARAVTSVRGAGPLRQRVRAPRAGRVLLVGDAAGYVDALTGEGIAVGLASAREAVAAIVASRPEDYAAAWRRVSRRYRWSAGGLLVVAGNPVLRRGLVPAAAAMPAAFRWAVDHVA